MRASPIPPERSELIRNIEELRRAAGKVRYNTPEDEVRRAWSRYHHALQAAYERGLLVERE